MCCKLGEGRNATSSRHPKNGIDSGPCLHAGKGPAIHRCMKGNNSGGKGSTLYIYYPGHTNFQVGHFRCIEKHKRGVRGTCLLDDDDNDVVVVVEAALKNTYNVDLE
jgi:hypothetical protein